MVDPCPKVEIRVATAAIGSTRSTNPLSASLLDVDLTRPFLLPNDLDLMA
jgi:hypothetical protein